MKKKWGVIKDPVHGYIQISDMEKEIIDSFPFQRLRRIRQLGGAEFVYPGATHTRFEHSLGTMYLANKVVENTNIRKHLTKNEVEAIEIAALLHDVGHGPFSHVFEKILYKKLGKTHEDITEWLIKKTDLDKIIKKNGYTSEEISKLARGTLKKQRKNCLDQIINSTLDVDKLDYIVRDTYHTGAQYGYVDVFRLINALDIIDTNLALNLSALSALESFIIARIESFKSIYFHRVGRAVQIMLENAIEKANDELGLTQFKNPEEYLSIDDYTLWTLLKKCRKTTEIIKKIESRKIIKCVYERPFHITNKKISSVFSREKRRKELQIEIANKAGVNEEEVIIDVPTISLVPNYYPILNVQTKNPVLYKIQKGKKIYQNLNQVSKIFEVFRGFMNVLRVYTNEEKMKKVEKATIKIIDF